MDDIDFADWQLCWQVNLRFHKSEEPQKPQKCIVCSKVYNYTVGTQRSSFWLDATRCSAGHSQETKTRSRKLRHGVCATCDQMYTFDVVTGKHTCRRKGCRRIVRVHEAPLKERLISEKVLLKVYECAIHCDEVSYDSNPSLAFKPPTSDCDHDRNVCDGCLKAAFQIAVRSGRLQDLVCPDVECKKPIPLETIRTNVSAEVFKIYNKQLALKTISKDENFRWCTCGHGQIHGLGESNPEWICLSCSKRHCYICKDDCFDICEHLTAIDAEKRIKKSNQKKTALSILSESARRAQMAEQQAKENKAGTIREIARITKKCPKKGCCNKIERKSGCGYFRCNMCDTEFCWCCKVIWKGGNALHLFGCTIGEKSQVAREDLDQSAYAVGWDKDVGYDLSLDKGLWLISSQK